MITAAVSKERTAVPLRRAWMVVPCFFCFGRWVGWRMRIAWVERSKPAELRS